MNTQIVKTIGKKMPLFLLLLTLLACSKKDNTSTGSSGTDKCKGVVCNNGGTCKDGTCDCVPGYEGNKCEIISRDKYLGTYEGVNKGNGHINPDGTPCTVVVSPYPHNETYVNVTGLKYTAILSFTPPPCKATNVHFAYFDSNSSLPHHVVGKFVDGNTNKLAISWWSPGGERQNFEGTRK